MSDAAGGQTKKRSGMWPWNLAPWRFLVTSTREESGSPTGESLARVGLAKAEEYLETAQGHLFQAAKRNKTSGSAWRGRWSPAESFGCFWRPKQQHICLRMGIL